MFDGGIQEGAVYEQAHPRSRSQRDCRRGSETSEAKSKAKQKQKQKETQRTYIQYCTSYSTYQTQRGKRTEPVAQPRRAGWRASPAYSEASRHCASPAPWKGGKGRAITGIPAGERLLGAPRYVWSQPDLQLDGIPVYRSRARR
jgi:hypothetical protein